MPITEYKLYNLYQKIIILGPRDYDLITNYHDDISPLLGYALLFIHEWFHSSNITMNYNNVNTYGDFFLSALSHIVAHSTNLEEIVQARKFYQEISPYYPYFNTFIGDMSDLIHDRKLVLTAIAINLVANYY